MGVIVLGKRCSVLCFISVLVPFLGIVTAECPPASLITPCTCENFTFPIVVCADIYDMETLVDVFNRSGDRKFNSFALFESTVQYLPASAISAKRFNSILLVDVVMSGMFDRQPDPFNNITMITIKNVQFKRDIDWEHFGAMEKLEIVAIYSTVIKTLPKSFVENMRGSIQTFHMYDCPVRKMVPNAFSRMTGLKNMLVQKSNIKALKRSMFPRPSKIEFFYFPDNLIETLPDDLLTEMPELQKIDFSGNRISVISEATFGNVYNQLKELKMEDNPVVCDCRMRWYMSRTLETLRGNCAGPEDRRKKPFQNLKPKDFSYCK